MENTTDRQADLVVEDFLLLERFGVALLETGGEVTVGCARSVYLSTQHLLLVHDSLHFLHKS